MFDYMNGVENAPSFSERLCEMALAAKAAGKLLMINEVRYSYAGIPECVTDEYVYFAPGSYEVGETGKLGSKASEDVEKNPYPVILRIDCIRGAEFVDI